MKTTRRKFIGQVSAAGGSLCVPAKSLPIGDSPIPITTARSDVSDLKGIVWISSALDDDNSFDTSGWAYVDFIPSDFTRHHSEIEEPFNSPAFDFLTDEDRSQIVSPSRIYMSTRAYAFWYFYLLEQKYRFSRWRYPLSIDFFTKVYKLAPCIESSYYRLFIGLECINALQDVLNELNTGVSVFRCLGSFDIGRAWDDYDPYRLVYRIGRMGCEHEAPLI